MRPKDVERDFNRLLKHTKASKQHAQSLQELEAREQRRGDASAHEGIIASAAAADAARRRGMNSYGHVTASRRATAGWRKGF